MGARIGEITSVFKNRTVQTITPVLALVHQGKGQYKAIIDRTAQDMQLQHMTQLHNLLRNFRRLRGVYE